MHVPVCVVAVGVISSLAVLLFFLFFPILYMCSDLAVRLCRVLGVSNVFECVSLLYVLYMCMYTCSDYESARFVVPEGFESFERCVAFLLCRFARPGVDVERCVSELCSVLGCE